MHSKLWQRGVTPGFLALSIVLGLLGALPVSAGTIPRAADPESAGALSRLEQSGADGVEARVSPATGRYSLVRAAEGAVLVSDDTAASPGERALAFLAAHGGLVGLTENERRSLVPVTRSMSAGLDATEAGSRLEVARVETDGLGQTHVRLKQTYRRIPVFGAELVVHMDGRGILAVNGAFVPDIAVSTEPQLSAADAADKAAASLRAEFPGSELEIGPVALSIYRTGLLEGFRGESRLAWGVVVSSLRAKEQVFVDAETGAVLTRISLRHSALYREIYSPSHDPMFLIRKEGDPPQSPIPGVSSIDNLYDFAGQTYSLFSKGFSRDSYNASGIKMQSVYLINEVCPNAYWDGTTTNYCPTFDVDDVVAHEWGHAYTQFTHNLIYAYQSGALNESYSDVWGEVVDLTNGRDGAGGSNNSQPAPAGQRWLVGEDVPVLNQAAVGILRDMWDPTRFGDPDKVTSTRYACGSGDGGGVHTNSGVPNHAFAMLVDGKTFNGQTVSGLGFVKATHIYYRAMTVYQTPTTNFAEHADALEQSCADLRLAATNLMDFATGLPSGQVISANDCAQLAKAMLAVEMRTEPTQCNFQPILDPNAPAACSGAVDVFVEDWEDGLTGWTATSDGVNAEWPNYNWEAVSSLPAPHTGKAAFAIDSKAGSCAPGGDFSGQFTLDSPAITLPAAAQALFVRFDHYVETELNFDGGNVLVSVNGGPFSLVPQSAYTFNAPPSRLDDPPPLGQNTNPKAGEFAWHGTNEGEANGSWGTTIIDLNSIARPGDTIRLRFDFGIDGCNGVTGWYVDTVRVYDCPGGAPQPAAAPTQNDIQDDATPDQVGGVDRDGNYKLSWSYPSPPVEQPCGFQIEEATAFVTAFSDDAEEPLVAGSNSKWTGNPQWVTMSHPDTGSNGYSVAYIDNLDTSLTMTNAVALPSGSSALLTFASFEDIEAGFDFGYVEVSNGGPFQTLAQYSGAFSGQRSVDLSAFAGQSIKVRFRFTSDIVFSFPLFLGWFIDDIEISTANFSSIATVGGTTFSYDVTGRADGTYAYRIAGIFGSCPGGALGPYSNAEQITVELGVQTLPPTASFTASPNPALVNQSVAFNGSASRDNDAVGPSPAIVRYFWAFGDGATQTTTGPTTSHSYSSAGTYRATLTVTDNDGETDTAEMLIEVTQAPQPGTKKVSGGGWIPVGGGRANFGFNAERASGGQVSGHLTYHDAKMKVKSEGITSLSITGNRATFSGPCQIGKTSGFTCTVDVIDNGEPGSSDFFRIQITNGYTRSGTLGGGNIKIHQ